MVLHDAYPVRLDIAFIHLFDSDRLHWSLVFLRKPGPVTMEKREMSFFDTPDKPLHEF